MVGRGIGTETLLKRYVIIGRNARQKNTQHAHKGNNRWIARVKAYAAQHHVKYNKALQKA